MDLINSRKFRVKELAFSIVILFFLVQLSEQQFSYSANWGKRALERKNFETQCSNILKLKDFLQGSIENLDEQIVVKT